MNETKKTGKQTKTAYRVIYAAEYANEKMEEMKVLNIYKLNIYHVLTFMFKIKRDTVAAAFQNDFGEISRRDPTGSGSFCGTKQNLLFRLEVQRSGIGF